MNILDKIVQFKRGEVLTKMNSNSLNELQNSPFYSRTGYSLKTSIQNGNGLIAEFKRKSPSKGIINQEANLLDVTHGYEKAKVSGISVLTDQEFFAGHENDLSTVRSQTTIPILRKDFIIDSYQIHEAKAIGADAILLIAKILTPDLTKEFTAIAHGLGMEVLLEVHSESEIEQYYNDKIDLIGINNRDLNSFKTDLQHAINLAHLLPESAIKIAESGIHSVESAQNLKSNGFHGLLIGEYFMKHENPGLICETFIKQLNPLVHES